MASNDRLIRMAALRHALSELDRDRAAAILALARSAAAGPADAAELIDGLRDIGGFQGGEGMPEADAIALAAFRYCLGRSTCMSAVGAEWLEARLQELSVATRATIAREIRAALESGRAGMTCDAAGWRRLLARIEPEAA